MSRKRKSLASQRRHRTVTAGAALAVGLSPLALAPNASADLEDLLDPSYWLDSTSWFDSDDVGSAVFEPSTLGLGDLSNWFDGVGAADFSFSTFNFADFAQDLYLQLHSGMQDWMSSPFGQQLNDLINPLFASATVCGLICNGVDGTEVDPTGGAGGWLFGDGGDGYDSDIAGLVGGNGGAAGWFGNGGAGGIGGAGADGGDGGTSGTLIGIGGAGGDGGAGLAGDIGGDGGDGGGAAGKWFSVGGFGGTGGAGWLRAWTARAGPGATAATVASRWPTARVSSARTPRSEPACSRSVGPVAPAAPAAVARPAVPVATAVTAASRGRDSVASPAERPVTAATAAMPRRWPVLVAMAEWVVAPFPCSAAPGRREGTVAQVEPLTATRVLQVPAGPAAKAAPLSASTAVPVARAAAAVPVEPRTATAAQQARAAQAASVASAVSCSAVGAGRAARAVPGALQPVPTAPAVPVAMEAPAGWEEWSVVAPQVRVRRRDGRCEHRYHRRSGRRGRRGQCRFVGQCLRLARALRRGPHANLDTLRQDTRGSAGPARQARRTSRNSRKSTFQFVDYLSFRW